MPVADARKVSVPMRQRILDEAERLIAVKGVYGFTLRDIAAPLGVQVPALYKHYRSRDDVLIEVSRRFIALLAGWYVVEIGRQPYTVYGVLRTADSVSPNIQSAAVLSSLIVYAATYLFIFGFGIWYLRKLLLVGPVKQPPKRLDGGEKTPARPLSVPIMSAENS